MPAVTQLTPNFLGGVSRQNDDKKLEGQVSECINGYPDPTYGLLKRPGMKFIDQLKTSGSTVYTKAQLADSTWFSIDRGADTSYIGAIKGTSIYLWTTEGDPCTITAPGGGAYSTGYLSGSDYHFRSIQDTTLVTNKGVTPTMQAPGSYVANSVATIKLTNLTATFDYTVTIQGVSTTVTAQTAATFDDMLLYDSQDVNTNHHLVDAIKDLIEAQQTASPGGNFAGTWCLEGYTNSLVIKRFIAANQVLTDYENTDGTFTDDLTAFTIEVKGGLNNDAIEVFEDEVTDVSKLSIESFHGHHVTILNSDSAADDYYVEYVAYNGEKGRGYWKEARARDVSAGVVASSMPHQLIRTGETTFTFGPSPWNDRESGDDVTNPPPSVFSVDTSVTPHTYTGKPITATFFYNNRLGLLSEDNVIFGVANDAYNFFGRSALTQIDSDPIDLNVSSIKPVKLVDVLPSPQGLTLFSEQQQFQVFSTDSRILTPSTTLVRTISNYEMDANISPVDVGTTAIFVSKLSQYSKVFSIQLQDVEQNPVVVDISKPVLEWIPNTIDDLVVSPQNSLIGLVDRDSSYLYLFRFYNNGERNLLEAWTKWQLTGTINHISIMNDDVFIIGQHEDEYTIQSITLDEIPNGEIEATGFNGSDPEPQTISGNACLDFMSFPDYYNEAVTPVFYDATNDVTLIYVQFTPIADKEGTILITKPSTSEGFSVQAVPKYAVRSGINHWYFEAKGDLTEFEYSMVVGYKYDFEVTLPTFYFRRNETTTDFTAPLTVSRVKLSAGRSGALTFKTRLGSSQEWTDVKEVTTINDYEATGNPVKSEFLFVVPIHQRNTNFELKVTSDFPYPVSLVSMMWEGNYTPRQYRRA
jgi:hypothetical protein